MLSGIFRGSSQIWGCAWGGHPTHTPKSGGLHADSQRTKNNAGEDSKVLNSTSPISQRIKLRHLSRW